MAEARAPLVLPLTDVPRLEPGSAEAATWAGRIGRKALSLSDLLHAGLPVPPAVIVTTRAYAEALAGRAEVAPAEHLVSSPLPEEVRSAIIAGYRALGRGPVAVRSSGTAEDLEGASFAGQYETVLQVEGEAAVVDAVRRCWASVWAPRVESYASRVGLAPADLGMGVILQHMVDAHVSGVLFTIDPATGLEAHMRIEAVRGLGEALVSGLVTPDSTLVHRTTGETLDARPAGEEPILSSERLLELVTVGRRVQALYGRPQDVEWVVAEDQLWLVQSRPVTAMAYGGIEGEWTTADFKDGGVSAHVCTPYMWSLYDGIWQRAMPDYLRIIKLLRSDEPLQWGRVFYGRPYWNLGEVKRVLHRVPGWNERHFDRDLHIEGLYEGDGVVVPFNPWTVGWALPTLFALSRDYERRLKINADWIHTWPEVEARYEVDPATLGRGALFARYRSLLVEDYSATEHTYFLTIFALSNAKSDFKVALDKANRDHPEPLSYLALLSGLSDMRHLDPLHDLWALAGTVREDPALTALVEGSTAEALARDLPAEYPELWDGIRAFLQRYRYHSVAELDITQPNWEEDPSFVLHTLQGYVTGYDPQRSPAEVERRQRALYEAEVQRARAHFASAGWLRHGRGFFTKLERVRAYLWWREELRDRSSRMYHLIRRETLAVAAHLLADGTLSEPTDVWFLRWPEVLEIMDGALHPPEARERIALRREDHAAWRHFDNPNELGRRFAIGRRPEGAAPDGRLTGIPCAPGQVTAAARVVPTIQDAARLRAGEILVTRYTDPGWTALFGHIAGVVTETGGILSHAAVIAREYGIPAVLAVPDATRLLADGQQVALDGSAGTVTPVAPPGDSGVE